MSNFVSNQECREQCGFQYKERSESLGNATGIRIFYTNNKPIVDRNYSGTPVSASDIVVYDTGVEITVESVNAVLGKITVVSTPITGSPISADYDWSNLEETTLENYISEAHGLVLAKISEVYTLPLSEVPSIVILIEKKLAAGLLLDKEYSVGGDETEDSRGRRWIKWAEQKLDDIISGVLVLLDSNGNELTLVVVKGIGGWPNNQTKDADEADSGGGIKFRISKQF